MLAAIIEFGKIVVSAVVGAVANAFVSRAMSTTSSPPATVAQTSPPSAVSVLTPRPAPRDLDAIATEANVKVFTERVIQDERTRAEFTRTVEISNHRLQLLARERMQAAYALPSFGYIRDRLPQDDLPAVFISDVHWRDASVAWVTPFESLKLFVKTLEDRGLCHDATLLPPNLTVPIVSRQQAAETCMHEFPSRPAIVVFHSADKLELNSYLLLWRPSPMGVTAAAILVGRISHHDHVTAADEAMAHLAETILKQSGEIRLDRLLSAGAIPLMASGVAERFALLPTLTAIASGVGDFVAATRGRSHLSDLAEALRAFYSDEPELATAVSTTFAISAACVLPPANWDRARAALRQLAEQGFDSALSMDEGSPTLEVRFEGGRLAILRLDPTRTVPLVSVRQPNGSSMSIELAPADWHASNADFVKLAKALERI